mmetsp:Transcript_11438/g.11449  ORF Transcript_11438/g.11449 Transcript_11438/m.11449 type:complete len:105 (+) Transcript_11438:532-846(+)
MGVSSEVTGEVENDTNMFKIIFTVLMVGFVIFPLSLARTISWLKYICVLSVGSMIYLLVVLVIKLPSYYEYYYNYPGFSVNYATFDMQFFKSMGVIYFAFTNQS